MAKLYPELTAALRAFIADQPVFFTASATPTGHVNVSPKGMDTFRCLDDRTVAYLDLTGSGNETAAHLKADGRLTVMFCAFEGPPTILRLYGRGRIVHPRDEAWAGLHPLFPELPGERQIVVLDVNLVQTSCGFGVPLMDFRAHRPTLVDWAQNKGEDGLLEYRNLKNRESLDGLPTGLLED